MLLGVNCCSESCVVSPAPAGGHSGADLSGVPVIDLYGGSLHTAYMPNPDQRVLVVDDDANGRAALAALLADEGYQVATAADGFKALGKFDDFAPHAVVTDLQMPGIDGLELLRKVHERDSSCPVIVLTAYGAVESAVAAMKAGAADYLNKPINFDELAIVLDRQLQTRALRQQYALARTQLAERASLPNMIGSSAPIKKIAEQVRQVAPTRASIIITGESGTGKELIAAALHELSPRAKGPFIKVHCAALAESLLESELFGHERGAFTGAVARRDGRFQMAHGGTLFLDEIGEISPSIQVKLLRFLQEREFERVGGAESIKVDVRVVAATNRDLATEVKEGRFREDLYYRLNVISIEMPALRDRSSDVPLLANFFLKRYMTENEKRIDGFSSAVAELMNNYYWPGNVRELENAVERAVVMATGSLIELDQLPAALRGGQVESATGAPPMPGASLAEVERFLILATLEDTGGSTTKAADILGISVRKIQYKLQEYEASR